MGVFFSCLSMCVSAAHGWRGNILKPYKHLVVAVYYCLKFAVNDLCIELFKQMHFVWKECHSNSKLRSILFSFCFLFFLSLCWFTKRRDTKCSLYPKNPECLRCIMAELYPWGVIWETGHSDVGKTKGRGPFNHVVHTLYAQVSQLCRKTCTNPWLVHSVEYILTDYW